MRLTFSLIAVFLLKIFCAFAQPNGLGYEPSPGWTHITRLDTVDTFFSFEASHDSLFINGITTTKNSSGPTDIFSYDGGKNWLRYRLPPDLDTDPVQILKTGGYPTSAKRWRMVYYREQKKVSWQVSLDLGQTWPEEYIYDAQTSEDVGGVREIQFNPADPKQIFANTNPNYGVRRIFRSNDGGRSWQRQSLPIPRDGRGVFYELLFDARNPKLWYVHVNGDNHYELEDYYMTQDDGQTFQQIQNWGQYAGIGFEGEMRSWWEESQYSTTGFDIYTANSDTTRVNFLQRIDTSRKVSDYNNGYWHTISKRTYTYSQKNPHNTLVAGVESYFNTITKETIKHELYVAKTDDNGNTWRKIWISEAYARVITIDQTTQAIWMITSFNTGVNTPPVYDIWKYDLPLSAENILIPNRTEYLHLFPNPSITSLSVNYSLTNSSLIDITLYDTQGKQIATLFSGFQEAGEQKLLWNIPAEIPSGTYFLKLESGGQSASQKIVITR